MNDLAVDLAKEEEYFILSPLFLSRFFKLVKRGVPVILGEGTGYAQPIYIDNLLDGMILAGTKPEAVGHSFNYRRPTATLERTVRLLWGDVWPEATAPAALVISWNRCVRLTIFRPNRINRRHSDILYGPDRLPNQ